MEIFEDFSVKVLFANVPSMTTSKKSKRQSSFVFQHQVEVRFQACR